MHSVGDELAFSLSRTFVDMSLGPDAESVQNLPDSLDRIRLVVLQLVVDISSSSKWSSRLAIGSEFRFRVRAAVLDRRIVKSALRTIVRLQHILADFIHVTLPPEFLVITPS